MNKFYRVIMDGIFANCRHWLDTEKCEDSLISHHYLITIYYEIYANSAWLLGYKR